MPDYEMWAPDIASMRAALTASAFDLNRASGRMGTSVFAIDYFGTKYVLTGTVRLTSPRGVSTIEPNWVAQPGVYANIRWMGPGEVPITVGQTGATVTPLAPPYYRRFA